MPLRSPFFSALRDVVIMTLVAAAVTLALYSETLHYGFYYDDYHFVRPYTWAELRAALGGTWDASGIEVPLYRPATVAFYALRFSLFGLNATAYHALSLTMFAAAATLFGSFVWRVAGRDLTAGVVAAVLFAAHPGFPYSAVCWVTNQMHLLALLIVLSGFHYWFGERNRPALSWAPLLGWAILAALVKEDGVMFIPAIVLLHVMHSRVVHGSWRLPPAKFLIAAALVIPGVLLARTLALGGVGGYHSPGVAQAWTNLTRGPRSAFGLMPAHRPWQPIASAAAIFLPAAGVLVAMVRRDRIALQCILGGLLLGLLFNLPFAFVTKAEQYHFVTMGAVLALTGGLLALIRAASGGIRVLAAAVITCALGLLLGVVTKDIARDFAPFGPLVLNADTIVTGWTAVPAELRDYIARKRSGGAAGAVSANPLDELDQVSWGLLAYETDDEGTSYRWLGGREGFIMVSGRTQRLHFRVRHLIEFTRTPTTATLLVDGQRVDRVELTDREWHPLTAAFRTTKLPSRSAGCIGCGSRSTAPGPQWR